MVISQDEGYSGQVPVKCQAMFRHQVAFPQSLSAGCPAGPRLVHLGCIDESPGIEEAETMLMAVAEASRIGEPVCMMILILKEQRYW